MSLFFPYTPTQIITYIADLFTIDLSQLSAYETTMLTIFSNLYFFIIWFIIAYYSLKIFNRIWERLF